MNTMLTQPFFSAANTKPRYALRFHFGWYTHRRQPLFADVPTKALTQKTFEEVVTRYNYHGLESEIEPTVLRALLSLRPEMSPSSVTKSIKGNLATRLRQTLGIKDIWSRGWFMRSNGHVTNETIRNYIASQYEHHQAAPQDDPRKAEVAKWHDPGDATQIRTIAHAAFEYNVHVVLVTRRRCEFLDLEVAERLVDYFRRVCDRKEWLAWDIEVVWNHAHLFLGLNPTDAPGDVALALMNNSALMLHERYGATIRYEQMSGIWQPGYYVGSAGSATTAQIKAYLRRQREGEVKR